MRTRRPAEILTKKGSFPAYVRLVGEDGVPRLLIISEGDAARISSLPANSEGVLHTDFGSTAWVDCRTLNELVRILDGIRPLIHSVFKTLKNQPDPALQFHQGNCVVTFVVTTQLCVTLWNFQ